MEILSVTHLRGGQRDIWWGILFAILSHWRAPEGPQWFSMDKLLCKWEVEIKYSTMRWFHCGNTEHYLRGRQSNIWRFETFFSILQAASNCNVLAPFVLKLWSKIDNFGVGDCIFLLFLGNEGPPKGPLGSPMVFSQQTSVPWEVEIKKFFYGIISLWECRALPHLRGGQRNIWWVEAFFCCFQAMKGPRRTLLGPPRVPMVLNGQSSVPWKVEMKYSTMG